MAKRRKSARPRKTKKSGAKRSGKSKRSMKKVSKARRPATATRTAVRRAPSAPAKPAPETGPQRLSQREKHVRIILVPDNAVACGSPAKPTTAELRQLTAYTGPHAPTDVIVFLGKAYQFGGGTLVPHPQVHKHKETVLTLHGQAGETAVWWSEDWFKITSLANDDLPNFPHSDTEASPEPFDQTLQTMDEAGGLWVVRSPVPIPASYGHQYKISFEIGGRVIDPHMDSEP
jgi:hypothetical protein